MKKIGVRIRGLSVLCIIMVCAASLVCCKPTEPQEPKMVQQLYVTFHNSEAILCDVDAIIVGTVVSLDSQKVYDDTGVEDWITFVEFSVEESLYGEIKAGDTIQVYYAGAPGKLLYSIYEATGSYPQVGERLLYMLFSFEDRKEDGVKGYRIKKAHERNAFGVASNFVGVLTVDVDGNLGYRYDPFDGIGYTKDNLPFYEYKTVEELKSALPQLWKDTEEWLKTVPSVEVSDGETVVQQEQQTQQAEQQGVSSDLSGQCSSPAPAE